MIPWTCNKLRQDQEILRQDFDLGQLGELPDKDFLERGKGWGKY